MQNISKSIRQHGHGKQPNMRRFINLGRHQYHVSPLVIAIEKIYKSQSSQMLQAIYYTPYTKCLANNG